MSRMVQNEGWVAPIEFNKTEFKVNPEFVDLGFILI